MTIKGVDFQVFDVGQGSCNYIRIRDDDSGGRFPNVLIDLGTSNNDRVGKASAEDLAKQINKESGGTIDVVVITHGDGDHYNLLKVLLDNLSPAAGPIIGTVFYGSDKDEKSDFAKQIADLKGIIGDINVIPFEVNGTGYKSGSWDPFWKYGSGSNAFALDLLVANVPVTTIYRGNVANRPDYAFNTQSAVIGARWNGQWMVATGDATATTFAAINEKLTGAADMPPTTMITAPHHGSFRTTYALSFSAKKSTDATSADAYGVVEAFVNLLCPKTLSISACKTNYKHPSLVVADQFARHTYTTSLWSDPNLGTGQHFLTTHIDKVVSASPAWPPIPQYATTITSKNIFSTFYFMNSAYNEPTVLGKRPADDPLADEVDEVEYKNRYVCPPLSATQVPGTTEQTGIPAGLNWTFTYSDDVGGQPIIEATTSSRPDTMVARRFKAVRTSPTPSVTTAAGRLTRSAALRPTRRRGEKVPA